MKKKSSVRKFTIAFVVFVIVAFISGVRTMKVNQMYRALEEEEQAYLEKIHELEEKMAEKKEELEQVDTLEFIEKYAREKLKMVKPNEINYVVDYPRNDE